MTRSAAQEQRLVEIRRVALAQVDEHGGTTIGRVAAQAPCSEALARKHLRQLVAEGLLIARKSTRTKNDFPFVRPEFALVATVEPVNAPRAPRPTVTRTVVSTARPRIYSKSPRFTPGHAQRIALQLVERSGQISTTGLAMALGYGFRPPDEITRDLTRELQDLVDVGALKPEQWRGYKARAQ